MMKFFVAATACLASVMGQEGNLIVHKRVIDSDSPNVFSAGEEFTVSINVHNIGEGSAYEVNIKDSWPEKTAEGTDAFKLAAGSFEATFDSIPAGESKNYNFTVVPSFEGTFQGSRAQGTYLPAQGAVQKTVISTASRPMTVFAADQYIKFFAKHTEEWAIFYGAAAATIILPLLVTVNIQMNYKNGLPKQD